MRNTTFILVIILIFLIGIIFLQVFLSRKESKWPGLILPLIQLLISITGVLGIAAFSYIPSTGAKEPLTDMGSLAATAAVTFLWYNIPTAVLLAIYAACREKRKKNLAMEKMRAQDLG